MSGRFFQQAQLFRPHDRGREIVLKNALLFAGPEASENQYRLANAALAKLGAFRRTRDAKPIGACPGQRARYGYDAMAVGVALDDGEHHSSRAELAARIRWIHVAPNRAQIVNQRSQTYFRPNGASIKFNGSCHWNIHRVTDLGAELKS